MSAITKSRRTVTVLLGAWVMVMVVMLVRLHSFDLGALTPSYDSTEAAQNYKNCMDETRALMSTGQLPGR